MLYETNGFDQEKYKENLDLVTRQFTEKTHLPVRIDNEGNPIIEHNDNNFYDPGNILLAQILLDIAARMLGGEEVFIPIGSLLEDQLLYLNLVDKPVDDYIFQACICTGLF